MPEHLRSLIIILILAIPIFHFARLPACAFTSDEHFTQRRNLWFGLTLAAFITLNFWLYLAIAIPLLIYANRRETNPAALFFFILFALPNVHTQIPGMGLVNYLFDLTHARVLALLIFLPAFFSLKRQGNHTSFGRTGPDKAFIAYMFLSAALYFRQDNITSNLRQIFYLFVDVFLPYYVISRSLKTMQSFRDALLSIVLAMMVLAALAVFEFFKSWLLYSSLISGFELHGMTHYLKRDDLLRAIVTAGQPIVLGYLMVVGIGLYVFIQRAIQRKIIRWSGMALLVAGLIAPVSRGPWTGAVALLAVLIITGRNPARRIMGIALAAIMILPLVSVLPGGDRAINLLPFIGTTDEGSVSYRQDLMTNSMIVIKRNLLFGSDDYLDTPEMRAMTQGEHIIDIVNSFIQVALDSGLVGLGLFIGFFALTLQGIYRAMRKISDKDSEEYLLGRVLLATLLSMLVIIYTVSSITYIPIMYWSVAALGVAYTQMTRKLPDNNSPDEGCARS